MTDADILAMHRRGQAVTDADKLSAIHALADLEIFEATRARFGGVSGELRHLIMVRRKELQGK